MNEIKGLVSKDWDIMSRQFKFMMVYIIVFIGIFSFTLSDLSFMSSFLSVILFLLSLNCFAYDEQVHFEKLLAASPVDPFRTVLARYISGFFVGIIGGAVIMLVNMIALLLRHTPGLDSLVYILAGLGVSVFIMSVMFPLVYKFGVNKSRIMIFVIAGIPTLFVVVLTNILPQDTFRSLTVPAVLMDLFPFLIPVVLIAILAVSISISTGIVRKKEY